MASENLLSIVAICAPFVAVSIGLLFNGRQINTAVDSLRNEVKTQFDGVNLRLASLEQAVTVISNDLRQFYRDIGKLEGRLDTLEKRIH